MRMIIAGSRSIVGEDNYARLKAAVMSMCSQPPSEIISGGAKGPDQMGERLAAEFGIPVKVFHPDWDGKGKGAGFIRNGDMAVYASEDPSSILVAMWDGESRGTAQMIEVAKTYGLRVEIVHPAAGIVAKDVTPKVPYIFGQSYSSLNVFETCPRQYEAKYITKEVKFVQSQAAAWGDQVHTVLENYLKMNGNAQIPSNMQMYQPFGDWVLNRAAKLGGQVFAERQAAVDRSHKPVPYKQRWIGGKIDVTILYPALAKAEVFDWKTGKIRNDATQLKLYGGFTFADYPQIETASAGYIWLEHKTMSPPVVLQRSDADGVWNEFEHKYRQLQDAYVRGVFPPKPCGLCRQYCEVITCEFHGKGRS